MLEKSSDEDIGVITVTKKGRRGDTWVYQKASFLYPDSADNKEKEEW